MPAWDVSPPAELSSITLGSQISGQEAVAGSTLASQPAYVLRIVSIKHKTFQRAYAR